MDVKMSIKSALAIALGETAPFKIAALDIPLEFPANPTHGRLFNEHCVFDYAKQAEVNPLVLAQEIKNKLAKIEGVSKIEVLVPDS